MVLICTIMYSYEGQRLSWGWKGWGLFSFGSKVVNNKDLGSPSHHLRTQILIHFPRPKEGIEDLIIFNLEFVLAYIFLLLYDKWNYTQMFWLPESLSESPILLCPSLHGILPIFEQEFWSLGLWHLCILCCNSLPLVNSFYTSVLLNITFSGKPFDLPQPPISWSGLGTFLHNTHWTSVFTYFLSSPSNSQCCESRSCVCCFPDCITSAEQCLAYGGAQYVFVEEILAGCPSRLSLWHLPCVLLMWHQRGKELNNA